MRIKELNLSSRTFLIDTFEVALQITIYSIPKQQFLPRGSLTILFDSLGVPVLSAWNLEKNFYALSAEFNSEFLETLKTFEKFEKWDTCEISRFVKYMDLTARLKKLLKRDIKKIEESIYKTYKLYNGKLNFDSWRMDIFFGNGFYPMWATDNGLDPFKNDSIERAIVHSRDIKDFNLMKSGYLFRGLYGAYQKSGFEEKKSGKRKKEN